RWPRKTCAGREEIRIVLGILRTLTASKGLVAKVRKILDTIRSRPAGTGRQTQDGPLARRAGRQRREVGRSAVHSSRSRGAALPVRPARGHDSVGLRRQRARTL